ncbi:MAG TPA: hypothetical protein EYP56_18385 [Planctomycetaceae bacterium]|nr:hypothetical protein [Planctomycetaceae bacterium]
MNRTASDRSTAWRRWGPAGAFSGAVSWAAGRASPGSSPTVGLRAVRIEAARVMLLCLTMAVPAAADVGRPLAGPGAAELLAKPPAWQLPDPAQVRTDVLRWLDEQEVDEATRREAESLWPEGQLPTSGPELLERLARTFAMVDPRAGRLVELCNQPRTVLAPPEQPWLVDPSTPPLVGHNLRLYYGRWLVHERFYDEAKAWLDGLEPKDVVDPASLLFYQAVVGHRLLDQRGALGAIDKLLAGAEASPRRYRAVAELMQADLAGLREGTLDHIARRMEDIQRRLDLGRAGSRVLEIERGVIESLDKLIEEIEKQRQQQLATAGAGQLQPSAPAQDSRIMGGKGPGHVTKRSIGSQSGWGNLPPKQREEALQQIGREFPAHYRDVIEQYFRKLAGQEASDDMSGR